MKILSYTHQIVIDNYKMGVGYDKKVYDSGLFRTSMTQAASSVEACQFACFKQLRQFVNVEHHLRNLCAALDDKRLVVIVDDDVNLIIVAAVDSALNDICVKPLLFRFKPLK